MFSFYSTAFVSSLMAEEVRAVKSSQMEGKIDHS